MTAKMLKFISTYPAYLSGAVQAIVNAVIVFGLVHWTPAEIAALNTAGAAVLFGWVHAAVTPNVKLPK